MQSVVDKKLESAAGKAHKADLRQQITHLKPISATRLITGFFLEAFMAIHNRAGPDFVPKPNGKPIRVLTGSMGIQIGLRLVIPGDSDRTIPRKLVISFHSSAHPGHMFPRKLSEWSRRPSIEPPRMAPNVLNLHMSQDIWASTGAKMACPFSL